MTSPARPNILFIMSDDHAAHAISSYGSELVETPHIDRIATEGARLDRVFCTNSLCVPSRASILTGEYSHRNGVYTLDDEIDNERETFIKMLQSSGYQTAMVGKWHLGHGPASDPTGFDFWEVLPGQGVYDDPEFITEDGTHTRQGYVTDLITDISVDWLDSLDRDRPFALMCHHKAVHSPWDPAERHRELFADTEMPEPTTLWDDYSTREAAAAATRMRLESMPPVYVKQPAPDGMTPDEAKAWSWTRVNPPSLSDRDWKYQAFIKDYLRCATALDESVGRLLDYLDETGLADNTLVIYCSDQGFFLGDHGWFDKRFMYDPSLQMPFVARWPGVIEPGSTTDAMVTNVDFAPTFLEAARLPIPAFMQGASMLPVLTGKAPENWQDAVYYRYWMYPNAHDVWPHYGVRTSRYKLIRYDPKVVTTPAGEWELFDLEADPDELRNVYADPDYARIVDELTAELTRLQDEVGDHDRW